MSALLTLLFVASTFTNPVLSTAPDPWVIYHNGFYYEMNSTGQDLVIRRTKDITDLRNAERKVVWVPPPNMPYSHELWAPELHFIQGKWYIYFAADSGTNQPIASGCWKIPLMIPWTVSG